MLWDRKDHGSEGDQNPEGAQNPEGTWVPLEVTVGGGVEQLGGVLGGSMPVRMLGEVSIVTYTGAGPAP